MEPAITGTGHNTNHRLTFADNKLAAALYGGQNAHLRRIEEALGVRIASRGNEIVIDGAAAGKARAVLEALWARLQQGQEVDPATVDSALRFLDAQDHGPSSGADLHDFSTARGAILTRKKKIQPRTPVQGEYIEALAARKLVFGIGPAGTGKTYLAVATAVSMLEQGLVERIVLSRPAVEAGERLGFLPGEMKEKMDPYMRPLYDALHDTMAADKLQKRMAAEEIEIAPLAFMRGRTLNNAFVILDEAQNATPIQMLMFLTRLGEGSRMAITGDPAQTDLPRDADSGLTDAVRTLADIEDIAFVTFTVRDVVRDKLVSRIIQAYDSRES